MSNVTLARKHWDEAFDHFWNRDRERAIEAGRQALRLNPALARPHWIIGQAYSTLDPIDREAAIKEFRQLAQKDPHWPHSHGALGMTLAKQGRIDEALKCLREAFRLAPDQAWTRIELARLLLKRNNYQKAISVLRGPGSAFYTSIDAYRLLARTLEENGNYGRGHAREVWEHILTFDESMPTNRPAMAEARERLAAKPPASPGEILLARLKNRESEGGVNQ
jgi:predicted Zn-dependent protease